MNQVDLVLSLDCLLELRTIVAIKHAVNLDLLGYPQQVILAAPVCLVDLASIDLFLGIDIWTDDQFVILSVVLINQISYFLGFDYQLELVHTDDLLVVDDEVIDPANVRFLLSLCQVRACRGVHG